MATLFNSLALAYDAWFEDKGRLIFNMEVEAFREVVSTLPKPWLEIGVGSGRFAQALGIEFGLDPSIQLLNIARRRGVNTILGKGEATPFSSESFGVVFLIVALCFVNSPQLVLKETNRLLKKGGKVVLGLVLRESPWGQFYQAQKKAGHRFYKDATFYGYDEVTGLLEQAGLSVERVYSTLFQKPGNVNYIESPRLGLAPDAGFTAIIAAECGGDSDS